MIRTISAPETHALRLPILRAGMPPDSAIFPGDESADARHFGAFAGDRLVGVASIYPAPLPERPDLKATWQLRGMATLPEVRGQGFGRALVQACLEHAREQGADALWCNARTPAVSFYEHFGLATLGPEFEIPTAGPHYRMWISLRQTGEG
jgi:GNAT superfamily N-acetyltransferase